MSAAGPGPSVGDLRGERGPGRGSGVCGVTGLRAAVGGAVVAVPDGQNALRRGFSNSETTP